MNLIKVRKVKGQKSENSKIFIQKETHFVVSIHKQTNCKLFRREADCCLFCATSTHCSVLFGTVLSALHSNSSKTSIHLWYCLPLPTPSLLSTQALHFHKFTFLYQHFFLQVIRKHLLQISYNWMQKLPCLHYVRLWWLFCHYHHSSEIDGSVRKRTLALVSTVPIHEILRVREELLCRVEFCIWKWVCKKEGHESAQGHLCFWVHAFHVQNDIYQANCSTLY